MKRILIVADQLNWCFDHRAKALQKHAPTGYEVDILYYATDEMSNVTFAKYDLVFVLPTNLIGRLRLLFDQARIKIPLVASHNSGVGRRHRVLLECLLAADYTVVNNYGAWLNALMFAKEERFFCCNISNGVDFDVFKSEVPLEERPEKVVWTGATCKVNGEEGDIKGFNDVLYPLSVLLPNQGFETDFMPVEPGAGLQPDEMREWYNSAAYVICASRAEGTPNIVLEGAACGCIPIASEVGNMPELIRHGHDGMIVRPRRTDRFLSALKVARDRRRRMAHNMRYKIKLWDWRYRAPWFYALFERLIQGKPPKPFSYVDTPPEAL